MFKTSRSFLLAIFTVGLIIFGPIPIVLAGQNQFLNDVNAEKVVDVAEAAEIRVKNLIDSIYASNEALEKITEKDLMTQFEGNVSLYNEGTATLNEAQSALEIPDYSLAADYAKEAMETFRTVLKSINSILYTANLKTASEVDASSLFEAIDRALDRISRLREILPVDALDQVALLDQAEALLDVEEAKNLIAEGKIDVVADNLFEANQLIAQVYQYLKLDSEEQNTNRICSYLQEMERNRERLREQFRGADSEGVDITAVLNSLGYSNEEEFMQTLQNMTQAMQGRGGNIDVIIQDLQAINQAIQQMNQTLMQETYRYQNRGSETGSGTNGNSDNGSGNTGTSGTDNSGTETGNSGAGNSGTGTSGFGNNTGSGGSGTDSGYESGAGSGSSGTGISGSGSTGSSTTGPGFTNNDAGNSGDTGSISGSGFGSTGAGSNSGSGGNGK